MKCALALVAEAAANKTVREEAERIAREEAIRKAKEEAERKAREEAERLARMVARSVAFCENSLGSALQAAADKGFRPCVSTVLKRWNNTDEVHIVEQKSLSRYADGRKDYEYSLTDEMSATHIIDYLREHCYKVTIKQFWGYSYGFGEIKLEEWTIEPIPECL